jgi:hypothetical protein
MADEDIASGDDDLLKQARDLYDLAVAAEEDNRSRGEADVRFARNSEQWPADIAQQRKAQGKPMLTINDMESFIRQVVNDARQNKPQIKVLPADSGADPETAEVISGLIRNIEAISSADVAYDTAVECGVSNGFGYIRVVTDYAHDDSFELDLLIKRVANPFAIYGDPNSTETDGSDWNDAFVIERLTKDEFKRRYGDKSKVDWDDTSWQNATDWRDGEDVLVAEWWHREEVDREIILMSDGHVYGADQLTTDEDLITAIAAGMISEVRRRMSKTFKVTRRIMSGVEILETEDWPGRYIPIAACYGAEYWLEGKRFLKSLIHDAKDAAMMRNIWRTVATEVAAMTPRSPFIGPRGSFDTDRDKWNRSTSETLPFIEFDVVINEETGAPMPPPQRQPMDTGPAAGAIQEAMLATDDMKSIMGLHNASLGQRSNETSGRAIMARQREGDVSTFHFIDNLARTIRHVGRILIDLIPHIYSAERIVRVLGEDGKERSVPINQEYPQTGPDGQPMMETVQGPDGRPYERAIMALHSLGAGKYDLSVSTGPSFTSRREEAATLMMEFARAYQPAAPLLMDMVARNLDWPGAEELAERLKAMLPPPAQGGLPPQIQQQLKEMEGVIQKLQAETQQLKDKSEIEWQNAETNAFKAQTERIKVQGELSTDAVRIANERFDMEVQAAQPQPIPAAPPAPAGI